MPRSALIKLIKLMFLVLVLGFVFVLLRSLSGASHTTNPINAFDDVVYGQTALRRYQGERVWVTRLNDALRQQASSLNQYVISPNSGCDAAQLLCVLSAATEKAGIDVVFSADVPAQLNTEIPWYGGFVDPVNGGVFDRLGRAYRLDQASKLSNKVSKPSRVALSQIDSFSQIKDE